MLLPKEFPQCPTCHSKSTIGRQALANEASFPKGTFISLEKKITTIQDFMKLSTPTTRILLRHYDTCSNCGLDRCIKVEKTTMSTDKLMELLGLGAQVKGER